MTKANTAAFDDGTHLGEAEGQSPEVAHSLSQADLGSTQSSPATERADERGLCGFQ